MNKVHIERKEIQDKIYTMCEEYEKKSCVPLDKQGNKIYKRGFIKGMFMWLNETYTSNLIVKDYVGEDLWRICCVGEAVIGVCEKYEAINNELMFSIATGISLYVLKQIMNCGDVDTLQRLNNEYGQDYKEYFKKNYGEGGKKDLVEKINLRSNVEDAYPIYCLLKQIREFEKDDRIERGKLGDITFLNAPEDKGGFGFAHPTMIKVDNRQLIIGNEEKLLSTYASVKKNIEEKVDLFGEEGEQEVQGSPE